MSEWFVPPIVIPAGFIVMIIVEALPKTRPAGAGIFRGLKRSQKLGQLALEFSGVKAHAGGGADEPFNSEIGALLPIALCGRTSL
jgi:hypothetical protein